MIVVVGDHVEDIDTLNSRPGQVAPAAIGALRLQRALDQCLAEFLLGKVVPHSIDQLLPQLFSAFLVNRLVPNDRQLMRAGRHQQMTMMHRVE